MPRLTTPQGDAHRRGFGFGAYDHFKRRPSTSASWLNAVESFFTKMDGGL